MKVLVLILFVLAVRADISYGESMKTKVKDMDRVELLQEILRRFFLPKGSLRTDNDVGFLSWTTRSYTTSAKQIIKFNTVDRNDGNGYNTSTGMFVAPVAGLYHFYWNLLTVNGKAIAVDLHLNGKERLRSWIHAQQTFERPSGSVYLRLLEGDQVCLVASGSGGVFHEKRYSTFGGELIRF